MTGSDTTTTTTPTPTAPIAKLMPASQLALVRAMPGHARGRPHSSKYPLGRLLYYCGVSMAQLSVLSGVSYRTIQNMVSSGNLRTLPAARSIAAALNVRVADLLTVEEAGRLNVRLPDDAWVHVAPEWPCDPHMGLAGVQAIIGE